MLDLMRKRRPINPQWLAKFEEMRDRSARYGDDLLRVDTFEMYEALPDDKPADCMVACDILEHLPNPAVGLGQLNKLARKTILITIKLTPERDEKYWRDMVDRHLYVYDWFLENGTVTAVCNAGMKVTGVKPVGALTDDARWKHVEANRLRVSKRLRKEPAHSRRAQIACYGPSFASTWERLRSERAETDCAVVTMSGSHDFLISRGIIPDYHIDCDPRPRTNITKPHKDVKYLIASACDPLVFDRLEGFDVTIWHVSVSSHVFKLIDELGENVESTASGGGSVGVRSLSIMYKMGYRDFSIYGMDCSFANLGTQQWAGPHVGEPQNLIEVKSGDETYVSSHVLATYATNFFDMVQRMPDATFRVYGESLLQSMCRLFTENKQLEAA